MKIYKVALAVLPAVLVLSTLMAEDAPLPALDSRAREVLKSFETFILKAKNFKVDIGSNIRIGNGERKQEISSDFSFSAERPNKISFLLNDPMDRLKVVSDGKNSFVYLSGARKYSTQPSGPDFKSLACLEDVLNSSGSPLIGFLVSENPGELLAKGFSEGKYEGKDKIDGKDCDYISFKSAGVTAGIWIESGKEPLLRKFSCLNSEQIRSPDGTSMEVVRNTAVSFNNWVIDGVSPDLFSFTPPADAQKIEIPAAQPKTAAPMVPMRPGPPAEEEDEEATHPLLGKDAPSFKLELADGGDCDISSVKGKKIIVLDFWATWCPPCRKLLPVIAVVTAGYADKDVVFFAVNLKEDKDQIREFLSRQGIKCAVALDKDAEAAKLYIVEGIPQSVIIGKDGIVQAVHVGLVPNIKEELKKELEELIAGKSLLR